MCDLKGGFPKIMHTPFWGGLHAGCLMSSIPPCVFFIGLPNSQRSEVTWLLSIGAHKASPAAAAAAWNRPHWNRTGVSLFLSRWRWACVCVELSSYDDAFSASEWTRSLILAWWKQTNVFMPNKKGNVAPFWSSFVATWDSEWSMRLQIWLFISATACWGSAFRLGAF